MKYLVNLSVHFIIEIGWFPYEIYLLEVLLGENVFFFDFDPVFILGKCSFDQIVAITWKNTIVFTILGWNHKRIGNVLVLVTFCIIMFAVR